jgi:hypothetical protein
MEQNADQIVVRIPTRTEQELPQPQRASMGSVVVGNVIAVAPIQ